MLKRFISLVRAVMSAQEAQAEIAVLRRKVSDMTKVLEAIKAVLNEHNTLIVVAAEQQERIIDAMSDCHRSSFSLIDRSTRESKPN